MKPFVLSDFRLFIVGTFFILSACDPQGQWDKQSALLLQQADQLEAKQIQLNTRIDSLWDATTEALAKALPSDFPPTDRDIFLKARNADHIRMFMSYKLLDAQTQDLVNKAGQYDEMLANQVRDLYAQRQNFEKEKIQFLSQVERHDKKAGQHYAEQLSVAEAH